MQRRLSGLLFDTLALVGDESVAPLREFLVQIVPGSTLRDGLDRVLNARMGALIVFGDSPEVLEICSGGFHIDAEMTPQRLYELAKMDGAIVLDSAGTRIAWANVHLLPDPSAKTTETGTRHRTAERTARSLNVVVVSVSEEMGTITLYKGNERLPLESSDSLISRAIRMMAILERFKERLDEANASLEASEIADVVTVRDVAFVIQRAELVLRVKRDIAVVLDELGEQGRLLHLQFDELVVGVAEGQLLVIEDYLVDENTRAAVEVLDRVASILTEELMSLTRIVDAISPRGKALGLDDGVEARGIRLLRQVPQVSDELAVRLVAHFGSLHKLVRAPLRSFVEATDMTESDAELIKAEIARLAQSRILERLD